MSNDGVRKVSIEDIQLVKNLIERCLQLYMNKKEVVDTLLRDAKIEPGFTELLWEKLEAENQEFFRAYYIRLILKDQIIRYNQLLKRQAELMAESSIEAATTAMPNGFQIHPMHNNTAFHAPQPAGPPMIPGIVNQVYTNISNVYTNGAPSVQPSMLVGVNMVGNVGPSTFMMHGTNGEMVKSEGGYGGNSPFIFGAHNNVLEPCNTVSVASVPNFNMTEPGSQALNHTMLVPTGMNSFGSLGWLPQRFSLSDLQPEYSNNILESYARSPFLGADANFLDNHIRDEHQDIRRLEAMSKGLRFNHFHRD